MAFGFRYPVALFNELYYLNAGGTIWTGNCILNPNSYQFAMNCN